MNSSSAVPMADNMSLDDSRTQRPYRYGMILLCLGALINWLGLSEPTPTSEPIRYLGVACILGGALLIMTAMCCWLRAPNRTSVSDHDSNDPIHVITIPEERRREKPPDYEQVTSLPPSYDEALKLNPSALLANVFQTPQINATTVVVPSAVGVTNNAFSLTSETSRPSSSSYSSNMSINKLKSITDKTASSTLATPEDEKSEPPPYSITPS